MSASKSNHYNSAIDLLRIIAIFAVIIIHTTTKTIQAVDNNLQAVPWALFLNQFTRFAVPIFFLISGFVLELSSPGEINYWRYLKKRLSRIFIPYLAWSAVYYFLIYPGNTQNFFRILVTGGASYQLYFIPALLIFYLIFPILHRLYPFLANKWVLIFLGLVQLYFLYHDYYFKSYPLYHPLNITLLNFFMFIFGIVISHYQAKLLLVVNKFKYPMIIITYLLAIYIFYEGSSRYNATGSYLTFYSQWRPTVFFYTLFLFSTLYYIFTKISLPQSLIKTLSSLSFFVFFSHVIILEIIWKYLGLRLFFQTSGLIVREFWFDPIFLTTVSILSFVIAYLCHKIPLLSKLTG